MIHTTLKESSDFSFTRCLGILTKLAILGALIYAGKSTYDTLTKGTTKLGSNLGSARIEKSIKSLDR